MRSAVLNLLALPGLAQRFGLLATAGSMNRRWQNQPGR